ncbi:hypothetical protein [Streptomyces sp. NBC_01353]|uniref:hypothetical protein n=1 Tax=Streptomyces sp. NBC_01353 TaxID=2903835 RepID=UPI002E30D2BF|nr:hypothetical protein [Streptomyces sp. NBC_01353]
MAAATYDRLTADTLADVIALLATNDGLYDRFVDAIHERSTHRPHDGHAPEALTVERLAEDIASAL